MSIGRAYPSTLARNLLTFSRKPPSQPPAEISDLARENINAGFDSLPPFPSGIGHVQSDYSPDENLELSNEASPVENEARTNTTDTVLALEDSVMGATSKAQTNEPRASAGDYEDMELSLHAQDEKVDDSPGRNAVPHALTLQQGILDQGNPSPPEAGEPLLGDQGEAPSPSIHETGHPRKPFIDEPSGLLSTGVGHPSTSNGNQEDDRDTSDHPKCEEKQCSKQSPVDRNSDAYLLRLLETLDGNGKLKELGFKKATSLEPETEEPVETAPVTKPDNQFGCSTCGKSFARRCELKCVIQSPSARYN